MITIIVATYAGYGALAFHPACVHAEWNPEASSGTAHFTTGRGALAALKEAVETVGDRL